MMTEEEEEMWDTILSLCDVNLHPRYLIAKHRRTQLFILTQLSSDAMKLPRNGEWGRWYQWHEKHNTRLIGA